MPRRTVARGFSLFRRTDKDGRTRWHAAKDLPPGPDGKRKRLDRSGATAREASARLLQALADLERAQTAAHHLTVGAFLEQWFADVIEPRRRPNTIELYGGVLRRYILPALGSLRLADLTPSVVQRFYATLERQGILGVAQTAHTILHGACEVAITWELLGRNPVARVRPQRPPPPVRTSLTPAQAQQLLAACATHPDGTLFLLALLTGMRAGELCGLTWARVDWVAGTVTVDQQIQWERVAPGVPRYTPRFGPLKGRRPHPHYLPAWTLERLRQHQDAQRFAREAAADWQEWGLVFPKADGTPQRGTQLNARWLALVTGLGFPRMTLHSSRHTFASLSRAAGVPVEIVAKNMGHASAALLFSTYSHPSDEARRQAAEALERLLTGEG